MSEFRRYLEERISIVEAQLKQLRREYDELIAAKEALPELPTEDRSQRKLFASTIRPDRDDDLTIKDRILRCLFIRPEGGTAPEILGFIKDDFGQSLERTSFSPQLSRLRQAGQIYRNPDGVYKLKRRERDRLRSELE